MVISGIGIVAPNGYDVEDFWRALVSGKSSIRWIPCPTCTNAKALGGLIPDDNWAFHLDDQQHALPRQWQLALAASYSAIEDAKLDHRNHKSSVRLPVVVSFSELPNTPTRDAQTSAESFPNFPEHCETIAPALFRDIYASALKQHSIDVLPLFATSWDSSSGGAAIAMALRMTRENFSPLAMVLRSDTPFTKPWAFVQVSVNIHDPARASCPFDRQRFGSIYSEAGVAIVLETAMHARARGVHPMLEIAGAGQSVKHYNWDSGQDMIAPMTRALADAEALADDVDYVCAYAPSDPALDRLESDAIKRVLGRRAYEIPVTFIKGGTDNAPASSGALQMAATLLAAQHGMIPPTANFGHPDPFCDLDYVPQARCAHFSTALINMCSLNEKNVSFVARRMI